MVGPSNVIEFRAKNPANGNTDTDLFDLDPVRKSFDRFAGGVEAFFFDSDGTKIDDYPYGQRVDIEVSTDGGSSWSTLFAGVALTPERTNQGPRAVQVEILGYNHFLTREQIIKDYTSTTVSSILEDLIKTYTPVNWVAGNVTVQEDDSIDFNLRGETVDNAVSRLASRSADEEFGVNDAFEFFFTQRNTTQAPQIQDSDVIEYDLPEEGTRNVNEFELFYTQDGSESVVVEDREQKQELKNKLNAPRNVVIKDTDHRPEISSESVAEAFARSRLGDQSIIQTGDVTLRLGRFDTSPGDVVNFTISDAGISDTDFRVAEIDYQWQKQTTQMTIAENTGSNVEDLLIALSDELINARLRDADTNPNVVRFLDERSGVTLSISTTITTRTDRDDSLILQQDDLGYKSSDELGYGTSSTGSTSVDTQKATASMLDLSRDVWQDGNAAFIDLTHLSVGFDDSPANVSDNSLQDEFDRVSLDRFGKGNSAEKYEFIGKIMPGGDAADQSGFEEFGIADAATGNNHYFRGTHPSVSTGANTRLQYHITVSVDDDSDESGVITSKGQERLRDLIIGESNHEPDEMVYGEGTTAAQESDTSLGNRRHADTIDSFADRSTGITDIVERITSGDADTTDFSEIGYENTSDELLARLTFEAYDEDVVLESNYQFKASNP